MATPCRCFSWHSSTSSSYAIPGSPPHQPKPSLRGCGLCPQHHFQAGIPRPQHCPSPAWMSHLPYLLRLKIGPQGAISDSATSLVVVFAHCSNHGHPPSTAPSGWSSPSCLHCSDTLPFPGCLLIIKTLGAGNTQPPPLSPLPPTLRS